MNDAPQLTIEGEVQRPLSLSFDDLAAVEERWQIADVSQVDPKRKGDAVKLAGLLALAGPKPAAKYLGLHSSSDNFHASIPLGAVRENAFCIYRLDGGPLPASAGGPIRFYIPDHAACHSAEIDECANVKFVDRIELTAAKGFDNRPQDEDQHARLHEEQGSFSSGE